MKILVSKGNIPKLKMGQPFKAGKLELVHSDVYNPAWFLKWEAPGIMSLLWTSAKENFGFIS